METLLTINLNHGESNRVSGMVKFDYYPAISLCRPNNLSLALILFNSVFIFISLKRMQRLRKEQTLLGYGIKI